MSESSRRLLTIARHEYRAAVRSRVLLVLLVLVVSVTAVSVHNATEGYAAGVAEYEAYRAAAQAAGLDRIAPSPLAPLSLLRGVFEYLEIIGAVIAIAMGYLTVSRERTNRTLALLRSRPLTTREEATGAFLGAMALFATLTLATGAVGVVGIWLAGHTWPAIGEQVQLALAFLATLLYLGAFYCLGAVTATLARNAANGLVAALGIWLAVVLVLPQIGDTMDADNQLPGGLFQALTLDHDGEVAVLAHFTGYEKVRTGVEELSLSKHYERFAFAMSDVKERYRPYDLAWLLHEKRHDIWWLLGCAVVMVVVLIRAFAARPGSAPGGGP